MRFSGFDEEWEAKKLGDIITNKSLKYNPANAENFIKCIELEHLSGGTGQLLGYIDGSLSGSIKNVFNIGDVLFGKLRPYLKKYLRAPFKGVCSSEIWVLKGKGISDDFLYRIIQTDKFIDLANQSSGSKMPRADWNVVEKGVFSFPSILEQQKISSFFSLIDERIQTQIKIIKQLETLMHGFTEMLLTQKLRFKNELGYDFPNWEVKSLGMILTIGSGKDYKHLNRGDIPVFGTGGLMTHVNSFLYDGETICIGRKGTIDKPMYYNGKIWTVDTLFYTHSFVNCVPRFVYYLFKQINWLEHNEASSVPSLSKNTIEKIRIKLPSFQEQTRISAFLTSIDEKIVGEKKLLQEYKSQKTYLLRNMFI